MCEWLCYREWCDVQLVCGGRAFSAHRAVLASVSTFLRRLLLSCPTDESPTFIVLPDYDLEAMSSVLYYIYNGEVMVKREKIEKFLDIIKAMQIFIDSQYVPEIAQKYNLDLHLDPKTDIVSKRTFKLEFSGSRDQRYVNLKKGNEIQYSVSNSDCEDKLVRTLNPSKEPESLGDLKSLYEDRQRNYFLRDLYIETYPRNGNVNGLTAGVLAISNECYRTPGSMSLLTNANGKHLSDDDALNVTASYSNKVLSRHDVKSYKIDEDETTKSNAASCLSIQTVEKSRISKSIHETQLLIQPKNTLMNKVQTPSSNRLFQLGFRDPILPQFYDPYVDYRISSSMYNSMKSLEEMGNKSASLGNTLLGDNRKDTNQSSRVTILNHVLESPWCPRIPNNYKPFRRKVEPVISSDQKNNERSHNDDNNNIDESCIKVDKTLVVSEKKELTELSNLSDCVSDEFKCNVCNQIFTSNGSLTTHMRRHSSTARYSCGECTKTFSQLRNFKYHMSIHKGTKEFAATCTVCGKYFNDRGYLSSHMKIHRNRKEYKCTQCPKSFNQRVAYNMHVRIHTGVKPHVCEECGKAFSRKMLLKQHQRTHSGERPYACPHCDKRFADRSNMTLHLRLHTGVKPFSCTLCPKSFTKKHHLKSHLNFHTGSKPYSCPRCKLAFTQSSNMRTHLKKCRAPIAENEN